MKIVQNERVIMCDVDDTLVMHRPIFREHADAVILEDPIEDGEIVLQINRPMVRLVKEEFERGSYIVVWSRGGYDWATSVVRAVGLIEYVHLVMTKPFAYFDDKDVSTWMPDRVYLTPETKYKK